MSSALSKPKPAKTSSQQMAMGLTGHVRRKSSVPPVDFDAIAADAPKGKESKSLRVEKQLLSRTEALRGQTNLNFSEYVETALTYFNAHLADHLSEQENQTSDAA